VTPDRRSLVPLIAVLLLIGALVGIGLREHWTLALPVTGLLRLLTWLSRGLYCSVPILALGALLLPGVRRRASELPAALTISLYWGAGSVLVIAVGLVALAGGLYTPLLWQALAPIGWAAAVVWMVLDGWTPVISTWRRIRAAFTASPPLLSWTSLLVVLGLLAALHASLPPDTRDELAYHLVLPQLWSFQGDWWLPADNFHQLFPANAELLWGYAAAAGGSLAPRFVTLVFALLTVTLLWQWMDSRDVPASIRGISLVLLLSAPVVLTAAAICYVEWPLLFFLLLGWRLSRLGEILDERVALVGAAVAWGAAVGIKYTAALFVGMLFIEWLIRLLRVKPGRAPAAILAMTLACAVLAAPWLIRNHAATGDPLYPLGGAIGIGGADQHAAAALTEYTEITGVWKWLPWVYHATVDPVTDHRLHPLWPLLHLAVLALGWRWWRELPWITVVVATLALLPFNPSPRVYMPLLMLDTLFLPKLLAPFDRRSTDRGLVTAAVLLMVVVSLPISVHYLLIAGGTAVPDYLLGLSSEDRFVRDRGLVAPTTQWIREQSPEDARVWAWCEDRTLYLERWARSDSPYGPPGFLTTVADGGTAALTEAVSDVDLVLLRTDRCPESLHTTYFEKQNWPLDDQLRDALRGWAAEHLDEVLRDDRHVVYRVKK
jgi:hypothetical protein